MKSSHQQTVWLIKFLHFRALSLWIPTLTTRRNVCSAKEENDDPLRDNIYISICIIMILDHWSSFYNEILNKNTPIWKKKPIWYWKACSPKLIETHRNNLHNQPRHHRIVMKIINSILYSVCFLIYSSLINWSALGVGTYFLPPIMIVVTQWSIKCLAFIYYSTCNLHQTMQWYILQLAG